MGLLVSVLGDNREVFDALRDGGPTKSAGAGRRFACTLVALLLLVAMLERGRVVVVVFGVARVKSLLQQPDTSFTVHIGPCTLAALHAIRFVQRCSRCRDAPADDVGVGGPSAH